MRSMLSHGELGIERPGRRVVERNAVEHDENVIAAARAHEDARRLARASRLDDGEPRDGAQKVADALRVPPLESRFGGVTVMKLAVFSTGHSIRVAVTTISGPT